MVATGALQGGAVLAAVSFSGCCRVDADPDLKALRLFISRSGGWVTPNCEQTYRH